MNRPGHGPHDFEERLRAALRRRADEVAPDPSLWARVKECAERRRRTRWLAAVATVTPLLAAVAVSVALGLPDRRPAVDLAEVGPVATATAFAAPATPSPTPPPPTTRAEPPPTRPETVTAAPQVEPSGGDPRDRVLVLATAPGLVVSDANAQPVEVVVTEPASQPGECADAEGCEAGVLSDIRARPGSSALAIAVTFLESFQGRRGDVLPGDDPLEPCFGQAGYATRVYGAATSTDSAEIVLPGDPCPSAPVWSPDGARLAWLERGASGGLELVTVAWDADPEAPGPPAESRAAIPGDVAHALADPRIVDWVTDGAGAPVLYVTGDPFGEQRVLYRLPATLVGGGVEPAGPLAPVRAADATSDSYLTYAGAGGSGPAYLVDRGGPVALELVRSAAGDGSEAAPPAPALALPAELVDPIAPDGGRVWLRARGGEVLLGDGVDQAWRARWDGTAWSALEELPGAIRSADFLEPLGS